MCRTARPPGGLRCAHGLWHRLHLPPRRTRACISVRCRSAERAELQLKRRRRRKRQLEHRAQRRAVLGDHLPAQSRCRCGRGEPSPGTDVAGGGPVGDHRRRRWWWDDEGGEQLRGHAVGACTQQTPSDRSLRGESRRSDGKATTLRSSRADLAAFRGFHALGTFMRRLELCRSLLPLAFDLEKSSDVVGASRMAVAQVALIPYEAGIGRVLLVWACCVRRTFSPTPAYWDGKRTSGCSQATSKHRAASAGLFATAGEPASGILIVTCIRDGRVPLAAGLRLEHRLRWQVHALP
jgi:hypothetical protein